MNHYKFLMCPPDYFGIEYSINPWMDTANTAEAKKKRTMAESGLNFEEARR